MERRIEWAWPRRTLSVVIAAAMVLTLFLVVERPSSAGAQAQTSVTQQARQASAVAAATASSAVAAVNALPAQIPPGVIARICASLLATVARLSAILPAFIRAIVLASLEGILGFFGCKAISGA